MDSLLPAMRRIRTVHEKLSEDTDRGIAAGVLEIDNACKHFEEVQLQREEELSRALSETQVIFLATRPLPCVRIWLCNPDHAYIDYRSCSLQVRLKKLFSDLQKRYKLREQLRIDFDAWVTDKGTCCDPPSILSSIF